MSKLIKGDCSEANHWTTLTVEEAEAATLCEGQWLVPLATFEKLSQESLFDPKRLGLWVNGEQDIATLKNVSEIATVIAINFPAFADGRGFSLARMIREHFDYQGELRAIGNFMQDQLFYLSRCGFDAFEVPDDADLNSYLSSLNDFSERYQAAVDEPQPLFRRRV